MRFHFWPSPSPGVSGAVAAGNSPSLSQNWLSLAETAASLSNMTYFDTFENVQGFTSFHYYDDEPNAAIVAQWGNYCFLAFRGTELSHPADVLQNFDFQPAVICPHGALDCNCTTESGFYDGFNTNYAETLGADLAACMAQCTNPNECLVITGHSQGGAIASAAGVLYRDYNPYVFSFAGLPALSSQCRGIGLNTTRWFHFVNSEKSWLMDHLNYDPFALLTPWEPLDLASLGYIMILSEGGMACVDPSLWPTLRDFSWDATARAHHIALYLEKLQMLTLSVQQNDAVSPLRLGYSRGSSCSDSFECQEGSECSGWLWEKSCS